MRQIDKCKSADVVDPAEPLTGWSAIGMGWWSPLLDTAEAEQHPVGERN